ncbi:hypothetical protein [Leucobacter soli]|uniref:hypothetical protein n=1 Tax=Leucobacter soli TaxID=2812850 RepID=UPI00361A9657
MIRDVNDAAAAAGVETVYLFDLRLDGLSGNVLHIRDSASALSHLYGEIADGYLTNLRTQYQVSSASASHKVTYYPGGDTGLPLQTAKKLQVPYLIEYDADATDPILNDWIQDNGDGTFTEYMTEFWWVNGLPGSRNTNRYPATPEGDANWAAEQAKQWAFGASALEALDGFFDRSGEEQEEPPVVLSGATPTVSAKKLAVGQKLTAKAGSWGPTGVKLSYQWLRNGKAISKATKSSYTLTASDRGKKISLRVTGALAGAEPLARTSKSTSAVKYGALKSATPKVSGTAKAKKTLKAKAGSWGPKGVKLSYQWLRNGKKISGATKSSYKVSSKDRGKKISVKVTGKLSGYSTVSKTSAKKSVKR